jgi:type I restriction enzyme, S subunit
MSWDSKLLGEVVDLTQGFCINKKSNHLVVDEGIPLLRITDMINSQQKIFISPEIPKKFIANKDDIIFTRTGQVGLVFRNQYGIIHNNCFTVSPLNEELSKDYLYWFLRSEETITKAKGLAAGAAQPDLNHGAFKSISITYPKSLKTQKRTADILSAYDDLIENNLKRIKLLEQAAQNIYKEWFVNLRFPGHKNTSINEETGLPVGWEEKALGEFTEIKKGKNITKSTIKEGNVPVVAGGLKPAYYHNTSNTSNPVITVSASGANAGYVNMYLEDIWASDCSYIDSNLSDSVFFIHNLLSNQQELIFGMQRGAAQPHVYPKDLKRAEFVIPDKGLIQKFEEQVSAQYDMKRVLLNQNQKLKTARDILLPRLMNRTIEV